MSVDPLLNQLRYSNRSRVKDDVNNLIKEFRTLLPRIAEFVHDNGAQSKLIVLSGTIPILYSGVQYNIPVDLFVCEEHPRAAPKLYVRPTSNMTVKHNHQHVSPDGLCYLPYIHEWTEQCSLVALIEIASSVFSIEPPLFSRPAGTTTTPINSPTHSSYNMYASTQQQQPAVATPSAYAAYSNTSNSSINMGRASPAQLTTPMATVSISSSSAKSSEEDRRLQLVDQVTMRLYEAIDQKQRKLRDDLDTHMTVSSKLSQSEDRADKVLEDLCQAKITHTEAAANMTKLSAEFEKWSAEESAKPALKPEERLVPFDPLSAQLTSLHSDIHAIDDAFYYLERALASSKNETVDLNTFLKECRQLARRQFLSMAHLRKINAQCLQDEADREAVTQASRQQQQATSVPPPQAYHHQQQYGGYGGGYTNSATAAGVGHQYSAVPYPSTYHK